MCTSYKNVSNGVHTLACLVGIAETASLIKTITISTTEITSTATTTTAAAAIIYPPRCCRVVGKNLHMTMDGSAPLIFMR